MPKWNRPAAKKIETISRGLAIRDGKVLLCRNRGADYWYFPGGHVEPGETAAEALEREFLEESGKRVKAGRLVLVHEHFFVQKGKPRHEYVFLFEVSAPEKIKSRERHLEMRWLKWDEARASEVKPRALMKIVEMFLEEHPLNRDLKFRTTMR